MNKESPSTFFRTKGSDGLDDLLQSVAKATRIANERVENRELLSRTIHLLGSIRDLCLLDRRKVKQSILLTNQLLMGVTESGYGKNWDLLEREIEYVRAELKPFIDQTAN